LSQFSNAKIGVDNWVIRDSQGHLVNAMTQVVNFTLLAREIEVWSLLLALKWSVEMGV
jgi:hypothetical protein